MPLVGSTAQINSGAVTLPIRAFIRKTAHLGRSGEHVIMGCRRPYLRLLHPKGVNWINLYSVFWSLEISPAQSGFAWPLT